MPLSRNQLTQTGQYAIIRLPDGADLGVLAAKNMPAARRAAAARFGGDTDDYKVLSTTNPVTLTLTDLIADTCADLEAMLEQADTHSDTPLADALNVLHASVIDARTALATAGTP
jgi:hypothetical protein